MTAFLGFCFLAGIAYGIFHAGHGTANVRYARARGVPPAAARRMGLRGPWISLPVGKTGIRIGTRL